MKEINNKKSQHKRQYIKNPQQCGVHHLYCASAVVEQLNSAQLKDLVQEGGRLVDVDRHGSLAGWISHRLVKVLQPGETPQKHTLVPWGCSEQRGKSLQFLKFKWRSSHACNMTVNKLVKVFYILRKTYSSTGLRLHQSVNVH